MSKRLYLLMILFFIMAVSSCDDGEEISEPSYISSDSVVKMGGVLPFTGSLSEDGKPRHQSALLATKHLAEAGFPVEWTVVDSKNDANSAVEAARDLVEKGQVQVIIGASSSAVTIEVAKKVSIPNQVPQIAIASTSPAITTLADQDFLFRTAPSDALQAVVLARLASGTLKDVNLPRSSSAHSGYKRVSVLYVEGTYGQGLNDVFTKHFDELGGEKVVAVSHPEVPISDLENKALLRQILLPSLQQAYADGETEVLIAMSYTGYAEVFLQQAIENNLFDKFLFVDATKSQRQLENSSVGPHLEGMCGTAPGSEPTEEFLEVFNTDYKAEYGEEPPSLSFMFNTYDAVIIAGLAAYAAQAIGEAVTPITIREYLRRVNDPDGEKIIAGKTEKLKRAMKILDSGLTIDYQGASGDVNFDDNGDVITPIEIWCYQGGEMVSQGNEQP
ncbi:MAG: hypothetical protein DRR08_26035 [Candidatus Parabeggiatoa sp. nov. 2]|nr:MAG: hypothetical protein B6247_25100 [Beggiatoa sp. 4572_84]RKZ54773.1 MAG: hypothetical protein DRR08_26035 [Gammaproteobacteria bacterium]